MKIIKKILIGLIITISNATYGGIIDYNDTVANSFKDTETGLVWLDTRITGWQNLYSSRYAYSNTYEIYTYSQNLARNADFRIANEGELMALMANAFTSISLDIDGEYDYRSHKSSRDSNPDATPDPLFATDISTLNAVGFSFNYSSNRVGDDWSNRTSSISGLYSDGDGGYGNLNIGNSYSYSYSYSRFSGGTTKRTYTSSISYTDVTIDPDTTTGPIWMVYSPEISEISSEINDIPEPSTLAIFALAMIGLASRRFKKQA